MAAVRDHLAEFGDAEIVVMTFAHQRVLKGYRSRFASPFTVITDEPRDVYRAFGFGRGAWWRVYGIRALRAYRTLLRSGHKLERIRDDTLQLGGDVVIAPDGTVAYVFYGDGPDDRPAVAELVTAVSASRAHS